MTKKEKLAYVADMAQQLAGIVRVEAPIVAKLLDLASDLARAPQKAR